LSDPDGPVGIFDSGVGGLSVLQSVHAEMPAEDLFYVGDSGYAPYGDRPDDYVKQRASVMTDFLIGLGAKAIVVACNTATGAAVEKLRASYRLPIVAVEPAVKPAAARTTSGVIGVLATSATVSSPNLARLVNKYGLDVRVLIQACPGLADQVEGGEIDGEPTKRLVTQYVRPLIEQGADILVLGCTHYPFLRRLIQDVAGPNVELIDPAQAVARELRRRLDAGNLRTRRQGSGSLRFWTSGSVDRASAVMGQLLGKPVRAERV